jgi:hypothetical protein
MDGQLTAAEAQFLIRQMRGIDWYVHLDHSLNEECYYAVSKDDLYRSTSWMSLCIELLMEDIERVIYEPVLLEG